MSAWGKQVRRVIEELHLVATEYHQDIFDASVAWVLCQGQMSGSPGFGCLYKGRDGLMCGIGVLLETVDTTCAEGNTVEILLRDTAVSRNTSDLLRALQSAHDGATLEAFLADYIYAAERVAEGFGLNTEVLDAYRELMS